MSENMLFCLGEGQYVNKGIGYQKHFMIFNQQLTESEYNEVKKSLQNIKLPLNRWIEKADMSEEEKKNVSGWDEMGGYLKTLNYEESWTKWWSESNQEDKNKILNCKYFDKEVFIGITGLKDFEVKSLSGKTVKITLDGIEYEAIIK